MAFKRSAVRSRLSPPEKFQNLRILELFLLLCTEKVRVFIRQLQGCNCLAGITPFVPGCLDGFDMVVDCLLGTGFQGALRENYRTAIKEINVSRAQVICVDINSGMNGATGEYHPNAIPCPPWLDMDVIKV